jgi:hypothetical protein
MQEASGDGRTELTPGSMPAILCPRLARAAERALRTEAVTPYHDLSESRVTSLEYFGGQRARCGHYPPVPVDRPLVNRCH